MILNGNCLMTLHNNRVLFTQQSTLPTRFSSDFHKIQDFHKKVSDDVVCLCERSVTLFNRLLGRRVFTWQIWIYSKFLNKTSSFYDMYNIQIACVFFEVNIKFFESRWCQNNPSVHLLRRLNVCVYSLNGIAHSR